MATTTNDSSNESKKQPKKKAVAKSIAHSDKAVEPAKQKPSAITEKKKVASKIKKSASSEKSANIKKSTAEIKTPATKSAKKSSTKSTVNLIAITFEITYSTSFGQNILLCGNYPSLGRASDDKALTMLFRDQNHWSIEVMVDAKELHEPLEYHYLIINADGSIQKSAIYRLTISRNIKSLVIKDAWNYDGFIENAFSTAVFEVIGDKLFVNQSKKATKKTTHEFRVQAPILANQQVIGLLGNDSCVGGWDPNEIILLSPDKASNCWIANLDLSKVAKELQYKYVFYNLDNKQISDFEQGDNRSLSDQVLKAKNAIVNDGFFHTN